MKYRILFKEKVENAIEQALVVEDIFLMTQIEILMKNDYLFINAKIVKE